MFSMRRDLSICTLLVSACLCLVLLHQLHQRTGPSLRANSVQFTASKKFRTLTRDYPPVRIPYEYISNVQITILVVVPKILLCHRRFTEPRLGRSPTIFRECPIIAAPTLPVSLLSNIDTVSERRILSFVETLSPHSTTSFVWRKSTVC